MQVIVGMFYAFTFTMFMCASLGLKSWKSVFITCGNNPEVKAWKLDFIKSKIFIPKFEFILIAKIHSHDGVRIREYLYSFY